MKKSKFAIAHKLSAKQESILCDIQRATIDNVIEYLGMLPQEVLTIAKQAQELYNEQGVSEQAIKKDNELVELVKKYWDKKGFSISQEWRKLK